MRLDHLLSKERHPSKGGMEPRLPVLGDGVLIGRRHWLVGLGSGLMLLYTLFLCGGWLEGVDDAAGVGVGHPVGS